MIRGSAPLIGGCVSVLLFHKDLSSLSSLGQGSLGVFVVLQEKPW